MSVTIDWDVSLTSSSLVWNQVTVMDWSHEHTSTEPWHWGFPAATLLPGCHCIRRMLHSPTPSFPASQPQIPVNPQPAVNLGMRVKVPALLGFFSKHSKYQFGSQWGQSMLERASPRCSWLDGRLKWYLHINCNLASLWCWVPQIIDGINWQPCSRCLLWYLGHNSNDLTWPTLHFAN